MTCQIVYEIKKNLNNIFNETFSRFSVLLNFNPLLSNTAKAFFVCYCFAHLNTTILQQNINFFFLLLFILRANNFHELFPVFVFPYFQFFFVFPFLCVVVDMLVFLIIKQHYFFFLIVEYKGLLYVYRSCSLVVFHFIVAFCCCLVSSFSFFFFVFLFLVIFFCSFHIWNNKQTNKRNQQWHKKWHI